jgi:hypothetical protein
MEGVVLVAILLAIVAFTLGRIHDTSLATKIGRAVGRQAPVEDPVDLLHKLNELREAGAITEAEYEAQKARILNR